MVPRELVPQEHRRGKLYAEAPAERERRLCTCRCAWPIETKQRDGTCRQEERVVFIETMCLFEGNRHTPTKERGCYVHTAR